MNKHGGEPVREVENIERSAQEVGADEAEQVRGGITLKPVYITSYQTGGSGGEIVPDETFQKVREL